MFYYFCRDGGAIAIAFISCLFGMLLGYFKKVQQLKPNIRNRSIYYFMVYAAIMSICWWEPIRTEFWMIMIWGLLLYRMMLKKEEKAYAEGRKE